MEQAEIAAKQYAKESPGDKWHVLHSAATYKGTRIPESVTVTRIDTPEPAEPVRKFKIGDRVRSKRYHCTTGTVTGYKTTAQSGLCVLFDDDESGAEFNPEWAMEPLPPSEDPRLKQPEPEWRVGDIVRTIHGTIAVISEVPTWVGARYRAHIVGQCDDMSVSPAAIEKLLYRESAP